MGWGAITQAVSYVHNSIKAKVARFWIQREVLSVLTPFHVQELAKSSPLSWPLLKAKHAAEVQAVRDGKLHMASIVDRRSWAYPYLPESLHRLNQPILKNTPYNLRRFSETPVPRRAINLVKNAVLSLPWKIDVLEDFELNSERQKRIKIGIKAFQRPNRSDSFRTFMEQVLEDFIIGGYGAIEPRLTPDYEHPFKLWAVDGSTIRIFADWTESESDKPRFAQMTGLKGERGFITFLDSELIYIRDNVRSNTPFGLGKLEVCFNTVNAFLGIQDSASKAGSDQVHKTWMWWEEGLNRGQLETVGRHIRNEAEGQAKISLISGLPKPEMLDVQAVTVDDLLIPWQEFLIRIIATGFDLSAMALGLERDVNRSTAEVMATSDFKSAVVPVAIRLQESLTTYILHRLLGWSDLQFMFIGLDDPDIATRIKMFGDLYKIDAITSDEVRKDLNKPPDPSGYGRLTMSQKAIIALEAQALIQKSNAPPTPPGVPPTGPQGAFGGPPRNGGGPPKPGGVPKLPGSTSKPPGLPAAKGPLTKGGPIRGSVFSAIEIAGMSRTEFVVLQNAGLIPKDVDEVKKNMEEDQDGILEQLSEELKEYFDYLEKEKEELKIKPQKISSGDESEQEEKFAKIEGPKEKKDKADRAKSVTGKPLKVRPEETKFDRRHK